MAIDFRKPVKAKRVGTSLIATFHRANPPLVWRFDLERNHSFTLALQGEDGEWELGVTSQRGEFYPIARFAAREDAEAAFVAVEKTLVKARRLWLGRFLKLFGLLAIVVLILLIGFGALIGHDVLRLPSKVSAFSPLKPAATGDAGAPMKSGVPLPADQVLRPPP